MPSELRHYVVWEGEWSPLKQAVTQSRIAASEGYAFSRQFITDASIEAATSAASVADRKVHEGSVAFSRWCFRNPWIAPASVITLSSAVVAAKSVRWGMFAAVRNGALMGVAATCATFPDDVKAAALAMMPVSGDAAEADK